MPPGLPGGVVDVPTSLFLGLVTETNAIDLPEGLSPDNQDVIYLPGSVGSRPGLRRVFTNAAPNTPTFVYKKTFVQPNENPLNLYVDSNGVLWQEDVVNSPAVLTQVAQRIPGVYAQSITAFGREFIAFSDGLHGADIPMQYDGVNLDRYTQEGPGAPPTSVADITTNKAITSIALQDLANISTLTQSGEVITVTTATPHGLTEPAGFIIIHGVATEVRYNGFWQIGTIISTTQFTLVDSTTGLANDNTGTVSLATVTVNCNGHGMSVGDAVVISGNAGTLNNGQNQTSGIPTPAFWDVVKVPDANTFWISVIGLRGQGQLNSTSISGGNGGNAEVGGMITVGTHGIVQMFLTRKGYLTKPSAPVFWTCTGNKKALVSGLAIGPGNTMARVLAMTGSGGSFYFTMETNAQIAGESLLFNGGLAPATILNALVIPDNTTTTYTLNIPDNTLLDAERIDISGNNLFAQRTVGPCLGFTLFADRVGTWGEYRRVENFVNMTFDGGTLSASTAPLGWTGPGDGLGAVVAGGASGAGLAYRITGDGVNHAQGGISQSAYQDYLFNAILAPNTSYSIKAWAKASAAGLAGSLNFALSSVSTGFSSITSINVNQLSTAGAFTALMPFALATPAVIPSDLIFTVDTTGLTNGATVTLDEIMMIFTNQPYWENQAFFSYVEGPEQVDGVTGILKPVNDPNPLRWFSQLRDWMVFTTSGGVHRVIDNPGDEPSGWEVKEISRSVGALSFRAGDAGKFGTGDTGEEWLVIGGYGGLYLYGGGPLWKISQENQPLWNRINQAAAKTLWIKNDPPNRRIYIGTPLDTATAPNVVLVMDYRELDTDQQISAAPPVHVSIMGKMLGTDNARKWTRWNVQANCGEILARPNGVQQFCLGCGNGVTPGQQAGFGQVYFLDPTKLTDDDYGQIVPYWTSYFFVNHEQEQALQLQAGRKNFVYSAYYVTGVGQLVVTPYVANLANPYPASLPRTLNVTQNNDIEIPLNVSGSRVAFKIAVTPLQGQTDVQFNLQKMIVWVRKHAVSAIRGAR